MVVILVHYSLLRYLINVHTKKVKGQCLIIQIVNKLFLKINVTKYLNN